MVKFDFAGRSKLATTTSALLLIGAIVMSAFPYPLITWIAVFLASIIYRSSDIVRLPILLLLVIYAFTARWGERWSFLADQLVYGLLTYLFAMGALKIIARIYPSSRNAD